MAALSVKVTTELADRFQMWCEDQDETVSSVLRTFVEWAVRSRRLEVCDPTVGPPIGWLYLEDPDQPLLKKEGK